MLGAHVPAPALTNVVWTKSGRSATVADCVEAGVFSDGVVIRNSNAPESGGLFFTSDEWTEFVGGARDGDFDHLGR